MRRALVLERAPTWGEALACLTPHLTLDRAACPACGAACPACGVDRPPEEALAQEGGRSETREQAAAWLVLDRAWGGWAAGAARRPRSLSDGQAQPEARLPGVPPAAASETVS